MAGAASHSVHQALTFTAWDRLCHLEITYPGFEKWFWGKVVPGLGSGQRTILCRQDSEGVSAIAITKRGELERKICTVWVRETARGRGLAFDLMQEAIDRLEVKRPLLTVPSERFAEFEPLTKRLGFIETKRHLSLYRRGVIEHVYNGEFQPTQLS